jgi:hypothetical protein
MFVAIGGCFFSIGASTAFLPKIRPDLSYNAERFAGILLIGAFIFMGAQMSLVA